MSETKTRLKQFLSDKGSLAIWGAGGLGQNCLKHFLDQQNIAYILDKTRAGEYLNGQIILAPHKLTELPVNTLIICSAAHAQIKAEALKMGFKGEIFYIYEIIGEVYKTSSNDLEFLRLDILATQNSHLLRLLIDKPQIWVNITFRLATYLSKKPYLRPLYWIFYVLHAFICLLTSVQLPLGTKIGPGFVIAHYGTIVFSKRAKIGSFFNIYHGCTVGTNFSGKAPVIGNFVTQYAGSHVLGDCLIADKCVIGANSVVLDLKTDIGDVIVGSPAVIKRNKG